MRARGYAYRPPPASSSKTPGQYRSAVVRGDGRHRGRVAGDGVDRGQGAGHRLGELVVGIGQPVHRVQGPLTTYQPEGERQRRDVGVERAQAEVRLAPAQHRARGAVDDQAGVLEEMAQSDQPVGVRGQQLLGEDTAAVVRVVLGEGLQRHVRLQREPDDLLRQAHLAQEAAGRGVRQRPRAVDVLEADDLAGAELPVQEPDRQIQGQAGRRARARHQGQRADHRGQLPEGAGHAARVLRALLEDGQQLP